MEFHHHDLFLLLLFIATTTSTMKGALGGGFEVELIHRDSPLSPLFNHSSTDENRERAAATRSLSRFHRLMTATIGENVVSIVNMGDGGGEFMMELLIGTPPITTHAIMDTGSDLTWIQCPPCLSCFPQDVALFDPTKSSTYHTIPCSSPLCHTIRPAGQDGSSINCTTPSEACTYTYAYADGSSSRGFLATENLTFRTLNEHVRLRAADFVFGCGYDNKVSFTGGGAGIIGLGAGSLSLISQLKVERRFSYCLPKSAHIPTKFKFGVSAPTDKCIYAYGYADGSRSIGVLASETFMFPLVNGQGGAFTNVLFGCEHKIKLLCPNGGLGVVGLGGGALSLVPQFGSNNLERKFSYYMPTSTGFSSTLEAF